jgi:hypothetical protein
LWRWLKQFTSYSSLFNVAPYFKNPNVVILDDAHSAEKYIPKMWSLRILRSEHKNIYEAVAGIFLNLLSCADQQRVRNDSATAWDRNWVEKISTPKFLERIPELISILDTHLAEDESDLPYSWRMIRDHLAACHLFLSPRKILLRPFIPPTFSHAPFAEATQRVYMSATLNALTSVLFVIVGKLAFTAEVLPMSCIVLRNLNDH